MKNRKELMLGAKKSSEKWARIPIVLDYHPALLDLHTSSVLKEILPETPIVSFRRPKSIKGEIKWKMKLFLFNLV